LKKPSQPRGTNVNDTNIAELVEKVRDGNESAFELLQEYLDYYIKLFGRKYRIPGCDSDEIEQECLFALRYKAIEDFDPERGSFKAFAVLCIRRHLFSLIKGNNQLKRKVLNTSLSLDEDRSDNGDHLSLISIAIHHVLDVDDQLAKNEVVQVYQQRLLDKLSILEQEVLKLYLQQLHYDEIASELKIIFPGKRYSKKSIDNALQRCRIKAQEIGKNFEW
jgi:RNA polymerase sporulation-specific sigma factor